MKKAIVVAHPDDEILFFSSVIEAVDEIIICFGPSSSKAVNDGRKRVQGRYPLKNIEWLNVQQSNVYFSTNFNSPKLNDYGIDVSKNKDHYETYLHHSLAQTLVKEPYYLSVKGNTNLKTSELPKKFQSNLTGLK